ncbi:MAG: hypothetical protein H6719_14890 [Sandaracinaceae bacterium]|nr:hypothetical protein [Sandaracinaceae bacterium]
MNVEHEEPLRWAAFALLGLVGGLIAALILLASTSLTPTRNPLDTTRFDQRATGHLGVALPMASQDGGERSLARTHR